MTVRQHRMIDPAQPGTYLYPEDKTYSLNEDWENGPIALLDTSEGLNYQAWHLTYANNKFTVTPEDTGPPVDVLPDVDSVQCSMAFDQNAHITIAWVDSVNQGHLYWYDTQAADWIITDFAAPVFGLALTLDDKRELQVRVNDILLWYVQPEGDHYVLYNREQRDRFADVYEMRNPVWPWIEKVGMNDGLRVQITLNTVAPT